MANVNSISKDLENIGIPLLKEIKEQINNMNSIKDLIEAASAKIISEIKKCPCNEEILNALSKQQENKDKQIVRIIDPESQTKTRRMLYSFPNDSVGFTQLGTGKNEKSIVWPPEGKQ